MSSDIVLVKLELDTKSVDVKLNALEKKTAESFSDSGSKNMKDAIDGLNKAIGDLNKSMSVSESASKNLKDNIDGLGKSGGVLSSISNGFKEILKIGAIGAAGVGIIPILSGAGVEGAKAAYKGLFSFLTSAFKGVSSVAVGFGKAFFDNLRTGGALNTLSKDISDVGRVVLGGTNSLFGFAEASIAVSGKLTALALAVNLLEGPFDTLLGTTLTISAAFSALASAVIVGLIFKVADLAKTVGRSLTESFQSAYQQFLIFRKESLAFTETINAFNRATEGASGTTGEWSKEIDVLSKELNFTQTELQKTVAELVSVGTRLGLNQEQTKQLLRVTSDYARITGKDLFQSAVAFSSALQGNSQAVLSYGVKLSEASNAQFALKQGIEETFGELSESAKTQVRFNNLISQYNVVQGVATTLSNDWFQQNKKLEISLDRLTNQIGLGAAHVEDFNLVAGILNKIVNLIPDGLGRLIGLFGAFTGRMLTAIGVLVSLSFKLFLVYKGFLLLDALLKTQTFANFATKTIPLMNKSLVQLAVSLGAVNGSFAGFKASAKTISEIFLAQRGNIGKFIFGVSTAGATTGSVLGLIGTRLAGALSLVGTATKSILVLIGPLLIKFALIAAAVTLVVKVFQEIEERTQVFALIGQSALAVVDSLTEGFGGLSGAISSFASFAKSTIGVVFGSIIFAAAKAFGVLVSIAADVSSVFSQKVSGPLKLAASNLDGLSNNLKTAGFNFLELGNRAIAGGKATKESFKDYEKLNELIKELRDNVGGSDLEKIASEQSQRINLVNEAFRLEALSISNFEENKRLIQLDAQNKTQEALRTALGFQEETTNQTIVAAFNKRQMTINEAYNRGLITQANYNMLVVQNQQALNSAMDSLVKEQSANQLTELEKIQNAYSLTAESAQKFMDIARAESDVQAKLMTATFETLGASIVQGAGAFSDFKSVVLNILGDFAIQVGVIVVGIGKAATTVASALTNFFTGPAAIIAGLALITLGGALKAMAGGAKGSTGPVGTAGGSVGPAGPAIGTTPNQDFSPRPDAERGQINPNVVINIEGSLFSTEQTGRTIVDMISKEFDKTGAQIRRRGFV